MRLLRTTGRLLRHRSVPTAAGLAVALGLGLVPAGAGPADAAPAGAGAPAAARAPADRTVLLVTGDRVIVQGAPEGQGAQAQGRQTVTVVPREGSTDSYVTERRADGDVYVIPSSALPFLGDELDPSLFDVSALVREGATDRVPVEIEGRAPGVVDGTVTAQRAPEFGAALAEAAASAAPDGASGRPGRLFGTAESLRLDTSTQDAVDAPSSEDATHPLELRALDAAGAPYGMQVSVANLDDGSKYTNYVTLPDGRTTIDVPAGHYEIAGYFPTYRSGVLTELRFVVRDISVTGAGTVTLDARTATAEVGTTTPRPAETVTNGMTYLLQDDSGDTVVAYGWISKEAAPLLLSPAAASPVGTRRIVLEEHDRSPQDARHPYTYDLSFTLEGRIGEDQHRVVRRRDLAALDRGYYADVPRRTGQARFAAHPFMDGGFALYQYFAAPQRRTEYVLGSPDITYGDTITATPDGRAATRLAPATYRAGSTVRTDLLRGPLAPGFAEPILEDAAFSCGACRQDDMLQLRVDQLLDSDGHGYLDLNSPGKITSRLTLLSPDGTPLADTKHPYATVGAPAEPGTYRLVYDQTRTGDWFRQASVSRTEWTFTSGHSATRTVPAGYQCADGTAERCSALPLVTATARLHTGIDGTMPVGPARMDLAFGHAPSAKGGAIRDAKAEVSFDGGTTWRTARLSRQADGRYTARWSNPRSAQGQDVMLRLWARDADGGTLTRTVTAAYTVASGTGGG
ncbi:hypothetical protein [Streptomyces sp. enrichment culture]|uniref:hypothetical protein n=1 Tax=Streptomyces sp. enrichment culture TaxID=1795815 RepID=UPI003F557C89